MDALGALLPARGVALTPVVNNETSRTTTRSPQKVRTVTNVDEQFEING